MEFKLIQNSGFLQVIASGEFVLEEAQANFLEVLNEAASLGAKKILFDGRPITGEPTTMERFYYGEFTAAECNRVFGFRKGPRIAYVLNHPVLDPQRFGENVAVNRGLEVKVFEEMGAAEHWLGISPENPPDISQRLLETITRHLKQLNDIDEVSSAMRPSQDKWSKKEELGHLIDSAQNNLRRFIVAQYEETPHIVYDQNTWVSLNDYNSQPWLQLLRLWLLLNQQIAVVWSGLSADGWQRTCNTGKTADSIHTVEWLAGDYLTHLRHHLHHILELEPVEY